MSATVYDEPPRTEWPAHVPDPSSLAQVHELLRVEHANMIATIRYGTENGWHDHAWQLACYIEPYLKERNFAGGARNVFEWGLKSARMAGDQLGESICLQGLASVCRERGSSIEAKEYLELAIKISRSIGATTREAIQLSNLGTLLANEDELHAAYDAFEAAEKLSHATPGSTIANLAANNLGSLCRDLGRFDQALEYLERALGSEDTGRTSPHFRPLIMWNIGTVLHLRGDSTESLRVFNEVLAASDEIDFPRGRALAYLGLGSTYRVMGQLDTAMRHSRQALSLARDIGDRLVECEALNVIAEAIFLQDDLARALVVFEQAHDYSEKYVLPRYIARSLEGMAHVASRQGKTALGRKYWRHAASIYPDGMVDISYVRRHLESADDATATCFRCTVTPEQLAC